MSISFTFVTSRLATGGGIETSEDVKFLLDSGITHIIDCRAEVNDASLLSNHLDIKYLWNGVNDDGQPKPVEWFQKSIEFAFSALTVPKNKVYSHCAAGVNRGPSTAYAILRALGLSSKEALTMIRSKRLETLFGIRYADDADKAIVELGY